MFWKNGELHQLNTMKVKDKQNKQVAKHNELIETSYHLNKREQLFVLFLISELVRTDSVFPEYSMSYKDIEEVLNFDGKRRVANKEEVFDIMKNLNNEPIRYEKGSVVGQSVWIDHLEYDTETDMVTFSLSTKLRGYLLELKRHFTQYSLQNIVYLSSHSIRVYEILKRHEFKGSCVLSVENLKFYLGLQGSYEAFYDFKRNVLFKAQKELKKYTDISFDFEPAKKKGKSVLSLKFTIRPNEPKAVSKKQLPNVRQLTAGNSSSEDLEARLFVEVSHGLFKAYRLLKSKGVNHRFIEQNILYHDHLQYGEVQGYEDWYMGILWNHCQSKAKVKKEGALAGVFVNWWKNGYLTDANLHARILEQMVNTKKSWRKGADVQKRHLIAKREATKKLNTEQYNAYSLQPEQGEPASFNNLQLSNKSFDLNDFKKSKPNQYKKIVEEVKAQYAAILTGNNAPSNLNQLIQNSVRQRCEQLFLDKK